MSGDGGRPVAGTPAAAGRSPARRPGAGAGRVSRSRAAGRRPRRRRRPSIPGVALRVAVESAALAAAGVVGVIVALARAGGRFTGVALWSNLLPFAATVLGLGLVIAASLLLWSRTRAWLARRGAWLPAAAAVGVAAGAGVLATRPAFREDLAALRVLVGGPAEAERVAIAHQVFAAYRRVDPAEWRRLLERARRYEAAVHEAAAAFALDPEVLMGIAAAESSFVPRTSRDGGQGLFQLTALPDPAVAAARAALGVARLDPADARHNAHAGAATLRHYLDDVGGDLFLGLLAYNMGPRNGGLRAIMTQYGARDFVTIQPYLQLLPRDYPIRVLAAALAYRLWRVHGALPRYEDGDNARRVQAVGVPGLAPAPLPALRRAPAPAGPR